jgi:hypothetical protein
VTWAAPWAWALAVAALLPVAAHLWSRRRPVTLAFPTLRFLRAASPVSRRLHRIQEWPLFLLRLSIVVAICTAAAGPTLHSTWRQDAWRARLHRIIVIDDEVSAQAAHVASDLRKAATTAAALEPGVVVDGLDEAMAQASAHASSMRTEIVVVWDGSRAALSPADLADIPTRVGLRLVPIDRTQSSPGASRASASTAGPAIVISAAASDAQLRTRTLTALQDLAVTGVDTPIEIRWPGAPDRSLPSTAKASPALGRVLDEIADDARVRDAAERSSPDRRATAARAAPSAMTGRATGQDAARQIGHLDGHALARTADGVPLLRGWADGSRLVLVLDASPASPLAWWSAVAAMESLARPWRAGATAERWSASELARAQREADAPATATLPGGLDTRAVWFVALALLLLEQWWRRRAPAVEVEVVDAA